MQRCAKPESSLASNTALNAKDPLFGEPAGVVVANLPVSAEAGDLVSGARLREFERTIRRGVGAFSGIIYRMTHPVIRKLFMAPRNVLGVQSAVVSLLAGDVFRAGPVRPRLYLFRAIYYVNFITHWPTAYRAWRKRRQDIRAPGVEA